MILEPCYRSYSRRNKEDIAIIATKFLLCLQLPPVRSEPLLLALRSTRYAGSDAFWWTMVLSNCVELASFLPYHPSTDSTPVAMQFPVLVPSPMPIRLSLHPPLAMLFYLLVQMATLFPVLVLSPIPTRFSPHRPLVTRLLMFPHAPTIVQDDVQSLS